MKNLKELDKYRVKHPFWPQTAISGAFKVFVKQRSFIVLAGIENTGGEGMMEHISVTPTNQKRCPTWDEMSAIKDMFFEPEEEAVQFFPKHSEYVNYHKYCLHIWRPSSGNLFHRPGEIETLKKRDEALEKLWAELEDVPVDPDTEKLEDDWCIFPIGTDKEEIWHWFDERHSKGVAYLLYGDGVNRTLETAQLCYRKQLCKECMSETCIFNPEGVCMFPMVSGRAPELNDNGCDDWQCKEEY